VQRHLVGSIKYYQFTSYYGQGLYHAVFTRHGGRSPAPWKSLNFGASVGDDVLRVDQNKETALSTLGINMNTVYDVYQVHSSEIVLTDHPLAPGEDHIKADAIVTNTPGVTLMMRFADCVPILLFDPINRAIGIVHAGWIGTVNKIAEKTIAMMKIYFGSEPNRILAGIGPSIGPDHYSINNDVTEKVVSSFNELADQVLLEIQGKKHFNLWKANQIILNDAGVENIEVAELCTRCKMDDWYSHRGEDGKTGRFGVVIGLNRV
jgi:polyphenol oxidase